LTGRGTSVNERETSGGNVDLAGILISQYLASLEMLKQTIGQCPDGLWNAPGDTNRFWQVAYHTLFFTHLYVGDSEASFVPWARHREGIEDFPAPEDGQFYTKDEILAYLAFCQREVAERVPRIDLGASDFEYKPFTKLELQIYSIRHLMQHTGELMERLGSRTGAEIKWVGSKRA
jgi:hypothetical protein